MKTALVVLFSATFVVATSLSLQAQVIWTAGLDDDGWPAGDGGGPNATFVQENGTIQPLPGDPASPEVDQMADNDYYFAGSYTTTIGSVVSLYGDYAPVGDVPVNEEAAERAFAGGDNDLRYHFNLSDTLQPTDLVSVTFDSFNLDTSGTDPRYGIEVYFNGVLVQSEIVIRPLQTGRAYTTPQFTLGSVNAAVGAGFDNIVSLRGINYSGDGGGSWMGIDYVQLNEPGDPIPAPMFPWAVGLDDDGWPVGDGGGPNATFVQEAGTNPLPGSPTSPEVDQMADDDYYFAGLYTTVIAGNGAYEPVGLVAANEEAAERAFSGDDNDLRYHFNLPNEAGPGDKVSVSFDALNLDESAGNTDPRYGVEVYFNGELVQREIVIRPAQLGQTFTTFPFTLGSVNAGYGSGVDNILTLRGINHSAEGGGNWMGIDYVQLNPSTVVIPLPVLPWSVGLDDDAQPFGEGGGTNANFIGVNFDSNPLPGSPISDLFDGDADDDYYFAGAYTTLVEGNGTYTPVGLVSENELSTEKGFEDDDNELRFHFNLPTSLTAESRLFVAYEALEMQTDGVANPRYGVEVYVNGVMVQSEVVITPAELGQAMATPPFTLASVNAQVGSGFDNIVTLRGINYSAQGGSASMSFDYFTLTVLPTIVFPWSVGRDDNGWPAGDGGGPDATFVQEAGVNPLPGRPDNPEVNQQGDDDYYFAGDYSTAISSVITAYGDYTPLGLVLANEEAAERAFAGSDNALRYHFNLPDSLQPGDQLQVTFDANNLHTDGQADPRYGIEIYFNGVLVQQEIIIRPAELDVDYSSPPFTLASVNAQTGFGADNIITLQGINYNAEGGGNWMGIDYVKLDPYSDVIPAPTFPWAVGLDDDGWPVGDGGGPNATFVQENGTIQPLPGSPTSPEVNQMADNDYYFAGLYTTVIAGNGAYEPVGLVSANEEAVERAFAGADNDLRYHFNLPTTLSPDDEVTVSFDALNLDESDTNPDPRYGIEVYFNGVLVQSEIVIRPAELGQTYTTPSFSLASVNAELGAGFDNIVSLRGVNYSAEGGGNWMGIDYVQLNAPVPAPTFPWAVGLDDDGWPVGDGGGPNATFVQENGTIQPLPGSPTSPEVNQMADNDYYFAGLYSTVIAGNGTYDPVGLVLANEEAVERAFAGADNDLRYHFNLPTDLSPENQVTVSFDALNLDESATNPDPRYGIEVYFNGVLVQSEIVIRVAELGQTFTTPAFTLGSVNAQVGAGFDNIVSLRGVNYSAEGGGSWMGIDYVQLNAVVPIPEPTFPWTVGLNDDGWPVGDGGGPNATFVQENGTIQPLPGSPTSPEVNQMADNDYYFAGLYTTVIDGNGSYEPVGLVPVNEEAVERAFAGGDNDLRYHFNLPASLTPEDPLSVSFDALNLDESATNPDPRYGIEVYFNGVLVQSEIVIRPAELGQTFTTPTFTLGSVNAQVGAGFDNIVSLRGINYSAEGGGNWMGIDYVQLDIGTLDTTPPVLLCQNGGNLECGSPIPTVWEVSATDDVDGAVQVICTPPSSAGLALGANNVVCTAADAAGNQGSCTFVVTVVDTIPATIAVAISSPIQVSDVCGQSVTIENAASTGEVVVYTATGSDLCGAVQVDCVPPSDTLFALGETTVTCTVVDAGGQSSSCSFTVTVEPDNECPTAKANVVPPFALAGDGTIIVIAPNNHEADVMFEAGMSSDPDGDSLSYAWFEARSADGEPMPVPPGKKKTSKKSSKRNRGHTPSSDQQQGNDDCEFGKVSELTLQYNGDIIAFVGVAQKGKAVLFFNLVRPGDRFTLHGAGKDGDMSPEIALFINGAVEAAFDTSGKTPLSPGQQSGSFEIVSGRTVNGDLCEPVPPPQDDLVLFGNDVVAERALRLGIHAILLEVSDGVCTESDQLLVEVITPAQALDDCIMLVENSHITRKDKRPLIDALKKAASEFNKGKFDKGVDKLDAFIKKVRKDKDISQSVKNDFVDCAQYIIDALGL